MLTGGNPFVESRERADCNRVDDRGRRSCVSGFRCGVIAIGIGIGIGIAATFTLAVASHCVGATVDFDTDSDTDLDEA